MTTQPIRDKRQIKMICSYFASRKERRNLALFQFGIFTALRISDILRLRWGDIYNFETGKLRAEFEIIEKKTKKHKIVAVNPILRDCLIMLFKETSPASHDYVFSHPTRPHPISRIQAYRILKTAAKNAGVNVPVSCHTLRKTFGYHLWKKGASLAVIMDIYNHSSFAITRRYIGITQEDKNLAYKKLTYGFESV
ncbi:MAG: tyrosine-type recombinase/integrase [Ruminococcus sp.]|jgi:integrase|nr:tyrosine-type recombinase/integrase [Ruminococcus sp.]